MQLDRYENEYLFLLINGYKGVLRMKDGLFELCKVRQMNLYEVTVTATKVKMYYRGDTLVYGTTDLHLPDSFILDEPIRQMPGVTLNATDFKYGLVSLLYHTNPEYHYFSQREHVFASKLWKQSLNTYDFVLNASVSLPFFKGKLIERIKAFGLLHQLSSTNCLFWLTAKDALRCGIILYHIMSWPTSFIILIRI